MFLQVKSHMNTGSLFLKPNKPILQMSPQQVIALNTSSLVTQLQSRCQTSAKSCKIIINFVHYIQSLFLQCCHGNQGKQCSLVTVDNKSIFYLLFLSKLYIEPVYRSLH